MNKEENNENPFVGEEKKEEITKEVNSGRKILDETNVNITNWFNLPGEKETGEQTPDMKIISFFKEEPSDENNQLMAVNKKTGESFYTGLTSKSGKKYGMFGLEVKIDEKDYTVQLKNWEVFYKIDALRKYCSKNNFTLAGQVINFKRINSGRQSSGENWELKVPSLKIGIFGKDNNIIEIHNKE